MTKQLDGIANKSNNADWSARSKAHSYHCDKAQSRHDLGGEGAAKDLKATETYPSNALPQRPQIRRPGLGTDG